LAQQSCRYDTESVCVVGFDVVFSRQTQGVLAAWGVCADSACLLHDWSGDGSVELLDVVKTAKCCVLLGFVSLLFQRCTCWTFGTRPSRTDKRERRRLLLFSFCSQICAEELCQRFFRQSNVRAVLFKVCSRTTPSKTNNQLQHKNRTKQHSPVLRIVKLQIHILLVRAHNFLQNKTKKALHMHSFLKAKTQTAAHVLPQFWRREQDPRLCLAEGRAAWRPSSPRLGPQARRDAARPRTQTNHAKPARACHPSKNRSHRHLLRIDLEIENKEKEK
jgi:hypothetical protein